ncbi:MAG: hypothetical protein ABEJ91_00885 [Candidatus Nanohaloarchaea archaeon]
MTSNIVVSYPETGNPVKHEVFDILRSIPEVNLDVVDPGENVDLDGVDLYHMAKRTDNSLSILGKAEDRGISTLNSYAGAATLNDRLAVKQYLGNRGFNVIETYIEPFREDFGSVIEKKRFETDEGSHDHRILSDPEIPEEDCFIELFLDGETVKTYFVDGKTRAVSEHGLETGLDPDTVETVESVGRYLDLSLYEVDILESEGEYLMDINSTVSMRNISDAEQLYLSAISSHLKTDITPPII